jgi:hypothetical protein
MTKILSPDVLKASRHARGVAKEIVTIVNGVHKKFAYEMKGGVIQNYPEYASEIVTSGDGAAVLAEKIAFDVEVGRENVERIFELIYDVRVDSSAPEFNKVRHAMRGRIVFLRRLEGGEVVYGSVEAKDKDTIQIVTYSAGVMVTREMKIYNDQFSMTEMTTAMGEANNAKLNDVHIQPILVYPYTAKNKQLPVQTATTSDMRVRDTVEAARKQARKLPKTGVLFDTILTHPDNVDRLARAFLARSVDGTDVPAIVGLTIIPYEGWDGVDEKGQPVNYPAPAADKAYLIRPKAGFKSIIKEDMVIEIGNGQVSRGITEEIVAHTSFGTWAAIEENVVEITLPA